MMVAVGRIKAALLVLVIAALPASIHAMPTVSVEPETTVLDSGQVFEVAIMVSADANTMSNFQIFFRYDTAVLRFAQALEGSLYYSSGLQTWFHYSEEPPGTCEVWDVIFPSGSFIIAPGELCKLRFEALTDGESPIEFLSVALKDIDRYPIEPVDWTNGYVVVGDPSGFEQTAPFKESLSIGHPFPNPAYQGASVSLLLTNGSESAILCPVTITDSQGRLVATLDPSRISLPGYLIWNGRNRHGRKVSAGVYFFRICTEREVVSSSVVIVQ
jgi:hypothetical protein